ncbi:mechanosensitive ion channel family protein [Salinarimonas ramus]|uniref:Mechanosensitive ion channel protein MscS n=1 Tax=Salinarimonas ramus TaxID=690164 RepID=A0A917V442_9HYPH|nr:mechanosensitive ion channel domain-containing protein [Salinarimonas ramus]GGK34145.1 mechanosensitive ion channel protein MscS [Salinarimonas ramus]
MEQIAGLADEAGDILAAWPDWAEAAVVLALFAVAALLLHGLVVSIVRATFGRRLGDLGRGILARIRRPTRLALVIVLVGGALPAVPLDGDTRAWLAWLLLLAFIVVLGWAAMVVVDVAADVYLRRLPRESEDTTLARKATTQVRLLRRIAVIVIGVLTVAALMTTSPVARQYGTSLFASAGVAGLVIGLAAQPVLSNIIAGLQLAITQPVRLEDAVIVEGEFGFVEDIRTSYVVVRLWDLRRLVVPLKRFIEQPFQNWTRGEARLIGSVVLHLDYTAPIAAIRARFEALVRASPLFDGETVGLQVIDAGRDSITVRGLMSARTPGETWDLRCTVREDLVAWLQETHPGALPQVRTRTVASGAAAAAAEAGESAEGGDANST